MTTCFFVESRYVRTEELHFPCENKKQTQNLLIWCICNRTHLQNQDARTFTYTVFQQFIRKVNLKQLNLTKHPIGKSNSLYLHKPITSTVKRSRGFFRCIIILGRQCPRPVYVNINLVNNTS